MRIGLVTGEYPPRQGGVGDYTRELARALLALGLEVHVITGGTAGPAKPGGAGEPDLHSVSRRWSWLDLRRVALLARELRLDLLSIQYQTAAYGLSAPIHFLPHVTATRTVVTFHDLRRPYLFPKAGRLRQAALMHLARRANGVIAVDSADAAELRRRGGVARLAHIPIGSNIAARSPAGYDRAAWRAQMGVAQNEFLLGYFGFLNESKGADTLISALAVLIHDRKAPVRLVLIGGEAGSTDPSNAVFMAQVDRLIKRHDLDQRLVRTGFVTPSDVSGHLLACDAAVLPFRDGATLRRGSLMAALAHGLPVITTFPAGPLPELRDGENVRLVPPESAPAIVLAVTQLLEASALRAHLAQGAAALAGAFSWPSIARRTLDFFRTV